MHVVCDDRLGAITCKPKSSHSCSMKSLPAASELLPLLLLLGEVVVEPNLLIQPSS